MSPELEALALFALFALAIAFAYAGAKTAAAAARITGLSPLVVSGAATAVAHTLT